MSDQNAQEPTMEEILASIRRIISEDDAPADAPAAAPPEPAPEESPAPEPEVVAEAADDDVLDLTDPIAPPALETHGDLDIYTPEPEPEPEPAYQPPAYEAPAEPYVPSSTGGLLSDAAAQASASAFAALGSAIAMPADGRTLEDVVKELLNPLLKAWLDQNLPRIVEAKVAEEVQRVSRGR